MLPESQNVKAEGGNINPPSQPTELLRLGGVTETYEFVKRKEPQIACAEEEALILIFKLIP